MDRLTVGRIAKPQGVGGELKITPLTDDADRFKDLKKAFVDGKEYKVVKARVLPNGVFVTLQGVDDRNKAELLRDKDLQVDRSDAVALEKGRYFIVDIIGCEVVADGAIIGKLVDVLQYGAADVYVISVQGGRVMIPAIDRLVLQVDVENKKILLDKKAFEDLAVYEE